MREFTHGFLKEAQALPYHPTTLGLAGLAGVPLYAGALRYLDPSEQEDIEGTSGIRRFARGAAKALPYGALAGLAGAGIGAAGAGLRASPTPTAARPALQRAAVGAAGAARGAGAGLKSYILGDIAGQPEAQKKFQSIMERAYPADPIGERIRVEVAKQRGPA